MPRTRLGGIPPKNRTPKKNRKVKNPKYVLIYKSKAYQ